jgi:hypothetical protein
MSWEPIFELHHHLLFSESHNYQGAVYETPLFDGVSLLRAYFDGPRRSTSGHRIRIQRGLNYVADAQSPGKIDHRPATTVPKTLASAPVALLETLVEYADPLRLVKQKADRLLSGLCGLPARSRARYQRRFDRVRRSSDVSSTRATCCKSSQL